VRVLDREDGAYLACEYTERFDQSCHRRLLRVSVGEEMQMNISICIYSNTWEKTNIKAKCSAVYIQIQLKLHHHNFKKENQLLFISWYICHILLFY